jgi:hypothetical protein
LVIHSQTKNQERSLSEILYDIRENSGYQFSYADDVIKDISIAAPPSDITLKETINYLRKETGLIFQFLKNKMIAISDSRNNLFICGYLIDNESRFPLQAVTVLGNNDRTISDEFGYFKLKIDQENEKIYIRHIGFQSLSVSPNRFIDKKCQNLYLVPQIETLSEVILRNYITRGIDKMFDGSFSINFSDFGILPGLIETDVLQTIQALPGIHSVDETVSDINIRGGTHDQNLILWDGIKMYQSGHFFGLISIFNPSITTDVSLIKNGTGVDLSDGVSGTISMKTANEVNNEFKGSVASNFINVDAFVDVPTGPRSSFQLSARKAISDIAETPTYDEYFKRILQDTEINPSIDTDIKFDFYDTSFRWLYDITEKDQLRLNFLYVDNTLVFNETGTFEDIEESKESNLKQITIAEGLMYKRKWNNKFVTTFQAYETDYELKSENADLKANQRVKHQNKVSESSFKLNTFYKYNDQLSFLNGYQFTETGVTNLIEVDIPIFRQGTIEVLREHSAFSQVNYNSNSKRTKIKAGARYSFIEQFNVHIIEPRISLSHKIVDFLSLELLGEMKHQNTSQIIRPEVEFLGVEKRRWRLSNNSDIPLLKSKQASIGLNYKNGDWLISTDVYYKEVNGITSQSQGFLNQYKGIDAEGSYNIKGVDFLVNKNFNKVSTWLSYTYGENKYNFNDLEDVIFPNNLDITHTLTLGTSYTTNNFKISAGFNYHSGKPTTRPISGNEIVNNKINYESANSSNIKDYLRIDTSATYKFNLSKNIKAHTGISIWNAVNQENVINNYYKMSSNNTIQEVNKSALAFTPNLSFRVLF